VRASSKGRSPVQKVGVKDFLKLTSRERGVRIRGKRKKRQSETTVVGGKGKSMKKAKKGKSRFKR